MKHLTETELVMALDGELEPDELQNAVEHLAECDACRGEWEKLQATSEMVAEYQKGLYPATAKPLAADERRVALIENTSWFGGWRWQFAAVAAMVVMAVGVKFWPIEKPGNPTASNKPPAVVEPQNARSFVAKNAPQNDNRQLVAASKKKSNARSFAKNAPQDDKATAYANQYTELPFSDTSLPLNDATVVRVSMPASVLRQAGVPVSEDNATAMLQADVVLGVDGLPRGIRLVKNTVANQVGTN